MSDLQFDFTLDKAAKTVFIVREFAAELDLVWEAFTTAEILDQWTAPKPFSARTKEMDFKIGGRRLYAMVSPDGNERWISQKYLAIDPTTHFKFFNTFIDADGNEEPMGSEWSYNFSEENGVTLVRVSIYNESLERMERMIEMGFKEGYALSLEQLENLLSRLNK